MLKAVDPLVWVVIFRPRSESWLIRNLVPGRFKHVSACCHLSAFGLWVTYDVGMNGTKITVIPDGEPVVTVLAPWLDGCTLVLMNRQPMVRWRWPILGWCAPSIARLIGLRGGALRPDALYRQCLRNGGTIVDGRIGPPTAG